jgi:ferritin-like metal-binding protein YciE
MAKAANSDKLRAAFEKHEGETEAQIERPEKIFENPRQGGTRQKVRCDRGQSR